jgi:predicted transcriptional regulator
MTGGCLGSLIHQWFPDATASSGAYALVTMGAVVAAGTHAPITAIIMIFELTQTIAIIPPLMAACVVSTLVTTYLNRDSIYTMKLRRRGIDLYEEENHNLLKSLYVHDVVDREPEILQSSDNLERVLDRVLASDHTEFFVVNDRNELEGTIHLREFTRTLAEREALVPLVVARDLAEPNPPTVHEDDDLDLVMQLFSIEGRDEVAVVAESDPRHVVGSVHKKDVIHAYNRGDPAAAALLRPQHPRAQPGRGYRSAHRAAAQTDGGRRPAGHSRAHGGRRDRGGGPSRGFGNPGVRRIDRRDLTRSEHLVEHQDDVQRAGLHALGRVSREIARALADVAVGVDASRDLKRPRERHARDHPIARADLEVEREARRHYALDRQGRSRTAEARHDEEHAAGRHAVLQLRRQADRPANRLRLRLGFRLCRCGRRCGRRWGHERRRGALLRRGRQLGRGGPGTAGALGEDLGEVGLLGLLPGHVGLHVPIAAAPQEHRCHEHRCAENPMSHEGGP